MKNITEKSVILYMEKMCCKGGYVEMSHGFARIYKKCYDFRINLFFKFEYRGDSFDSIMVLGLRSK